VGEKQISPSTIQVTISAISDWHRSKDVPQSVKAKQEISLLMRTMKIKLGVDGQSKQKEGISMNMFKLILKIIQQLKADDVLHAGIFLRDQAFMLLSYYGFLRRSEALALRVGDVTIRRTLEHVRLYLHLGIRKSKTDVTARGEELCISYSTQSGDQVLPLVQLYLDFLAVAGVRPQDAFFQSFVGQVSMPVVTAKLGKDALASRLRLYISLVAADFPN
jgi:hypothetical protein